MVAAVTVSLAGCILLVSPKDYGSTCHFLGMNTSCGSCIQSQCQDDVNRCCKDTSCSSKLAAVDECASGDGGACAEIAVMTASLNRNGSALAVCIERSCPNSCVSHSSTSKTNCYVPEFCSGSACQCSYSPGTSNDVVCSSSAFPETLCCAPEDWPAPGLHCSCEQLACCSTMEGCDCLLSQGPSTTHTCTASICCAYQNGCSCGNQPCLSQETQVTSCSLSVIGCPAGNKKVTSCSIGAR
jgi:hypothetical protein